MRLLLILVAIKAASLDLQCQPGFDYSSELNRCYKFVKDPVAFFIAEQNCINDGGHLLSIQNDAENVFITDAATDFRELKDSFWIGAADVSTSDWFWTDGSNSTYTNWKLGAVIDSDGGFWKGKAQKDKFGYICKFEPLNNENLTEKCSTCAATWNRMLFIAVMDLSLDALCRSGSIYSVGSNRCYKVVVDRASYSNSEKYCEEEGGHLASILDEDENMFISNVLQSSPEFSDSYFWIGAKESSGKWSWIDGSTFNYTNWNARENSLMECGTVRSRDRVWIATDCTQAKPYVCAMKNPTPKCSDIVNVCDSEWTYFEETNSCYKGFFHAVWPVANETCVNMMAHLASIHSRKENQFIYDLVTMAEPATGPGKPMTWFGLFRANGSSAFTFTDGTPLNFRNWAPGEPNNIPGEHCAELMSEEYVSQKGINFTSFWNNCACTGERGLKRRYVCKKPMNRPVLD